LLSIVILYGVDGDVWGVVVNTAISETSDPVAATGMTLEEKSSDHLLK